MAAETYWTYKAPAPPTYEEAVQLGAIDPAKMTEAGWYSLTPGMRREIARTKKKEAQ